MEVLAMLGLGALGVYVILLLNAILFEIKVLPLH